MLTIFFVAHLQRSVARSASQASLFGTELSTGPSPSHRTSEYSSASTSFRTSEYASVSAASGRENNKSNYGGFSPGSIWFIFFDFFADNSLLKTTSKDDMSAHTVNYATVPGTDLGSSIEYDRAMPLAVDYASTGNALTNSTAPNYGTGEFV